MSSKNGPITERSNETDQVIAESTLSARAAQFAAEFAAVNDEIVNLVEHCSEEEWQKPCAEGWPVAVVAHHVASPLPAFIRIVEDIASGQTLAKRISMDQVNERNGQHAREFSGVSKQEVIDPLRTHGSEVTRVLRALSDAQLNFTTDVFGGREMTLAQMIEMVVIGHSKVHLASMKSAIAH